MRLAPAILGALALTCAAAAAAPPPGQARDGQRPRASANPSAVIAAELAFARLAQDKGQWTAFRATMAEGAEMFAPRRVPAQQFLKGKSDPAVAVRWQPHQVWMSCDGSYGITHGAWQGPGGVGQFTTVWKRQPGGGFKWVLDQGDPTSAPLPAPEMIAAKVAECSQPQPLADAPVAAGTDAKRGRSSDGTLQWRSQVDSAGTRRFTVSVWNGSGFDTALDLSFAAPAAG